MADNKENISREHLSSEGLFRYYRGLVHGEDAERIERHLSDCELCTDALNGIAEMEDAMNIYNITHDMRNKMRKKRGSIRKKIFSGSDLVSIVLVLFIIGLIILIAFYFVFMKVQ